jgi:pilus assembly protein Flp/PilA
MALAMSPATGIQPNTLGGGNMKALMTRLWRSEEGQDLAEYALLIALIALVVIAAVTALGGQIQTVFNNIANALNP